MIETLTAVFDGEVLRPERPSDPKPNTRYRVTLEEEVQQLVKTDADLLTYWQREALIGMRSDIADSQRHARMIGKKAEQRTKA